MAIPYGLKSFLQLVPVFLLSLFFLRLVYWRIWRYRKLPPGPPAWPIVGNVLQFTLFGNRFEDTVKKFHEKYGPIFTMWIGSRPMLMIASRELAHEALIEKGSVFADRPPANGARKKGSSNQHNINSAAYGPLWRILRRNLVSEALGPSAMKAFGEVREWGIGRLLENLRNEAARNGGVVKVLGHFQTVVVSIALHMCFGSKPDEETVISVQGAFQEIILNREGLFDTLSIPEFLFRRRRARMAESFRRLRETLLAHINKRRNAPSPVGGAYVDTLLNLTVDGGRSLDDDELVTLCSEFIAAGSDTTATTLQWVMANLVIRQDVQARLYDEIVAVTGREKLVGEDDLQLIPYLEAVVKETLRRHPPGHFVVPHAVTQPCELAGYDVPADASVNFYVAGMAMDPEVWQNPSEFRPERFADEGVEVDLKVPKEIKMMPFGAGRRICAGLGLAVLHLNFIVARLVQEFAWECKPGETVDLSEAEIMTVVMKYPLQAVIKEREKGHK